MSSLALFMEMLIIFILIVLGFFMYRTGRMNTANARSLSVLVTTLCSPALQLNAAINTEGRLAPSVFLGALGVAILVYAILITASYLICLILKKPYKEWYTYQMLTVYGNTGFIGFPVCMAVLGNSSLVYASINNLVFNFLIYSYGMAILRKALRLQNTAPEGEREAITEKINAGRRIFDNLKPMINAGTLSAVLSVFIYLLDPKLPRVLTSVISYTANATVFLSMTVLGCTIAASPLKELITGDKKMYLFLFFRMLALPIVIVLLLKPFIHNALLLGTTAIMVSLPGGNLPLMLCKQLELKDRELSRGIILSTLLCIVTIPIVCSFL
ncbi:MAG: AEC family transporter [Lachnospiraceae bacterium]|nr:AEC family transporter [Lachnospiraceae bacterium]